MCRNHPVQRPAFDFSPSLHFDKLSDRASAGEVIRHQPSTAFGYAQAPSLRDSSLAVFDKLRQQHKQHRNIVVRKRWLSEWSKINML